jgi:DNA-binding response OmpR family regulator
MSGRDVADELRRRHPGLPVIFMSGYARDIVAHDGRLDEGVEFLQKPFSPEELLARVRASLDAAPVGIAAS